MYRPRPKTITKHVKLYIGLRTKLLDKLMTGKLMLSAVDLGLTACIDGLLKHLTTDDKIVST